MLRYLLSIPFAILLLSAPILAGEKVRQKLYITNSAGNDVTVVDTVTNKVIKTIEVGPHPHGKSLIALSMEDNEIGEQVLTRHQFRVLRQMDISR